MEDFISKARFSLSHDSVNPSEGDGEGTKVLFPPLELTANITSSHVYNN